MDLRLRNMRDVRAFSVAVTAVTLIGNIALQSLLIPPGLVEQIRMPSSVITLALAGPISFFVGLRMHDIHRLTLDLEQAAVHDPLTGAATRARFYDRAAALAGRRMTLIAADIDHFKSFNDRFGHQAGDRALRHVAATLLRNCRQDDVVARFGGEEFMILLPDTGAEEGLRVARRFCARLRETPVRVDGGGAEAGGAEGGGVVVTASFGVAPVEDPAKIDAAIARADAALYDAKRAGRDRAHLDRPVSESRAARPPPQDEA